MARKYGLCFRDDNNKLVPIDLTKCIADFEGYFKFDGNVLELIKFTTSFKSEEVLIKYLFKKNLIPSQDVKIEYAIKEPVKDEDGKAIKNVYVFKNISSYAKHLYVNRHANCFDEEILKNYLHRNFKNIDFYNNFYRYCLSKFDFKNLVDNFIIKNMSDDNLNEFMDKLISRINHPYIKKLVSNIPKSKYSEFKTIVKNELLRYIAREPIFRIEMAKKFGKEIIINTTPIGNISLFIDLDGLYNVVSTINENELLGYSSDKQLYNDYDEFVNDIWNQAMLNSKGEVNPRSLVDFGMFIANYEYYLECIGKQRQITGYVEENEEFGNDDELTEEELKAIRKQIFKFKPTDSIDMMSTQTLEAKVPGSKEEEEFLTIEDFGDDPITAEENGYKFKK